DQCAGFACARGNREQGTGNGREERGKRKEERASHFALCGRPFVYFVAEGVAERGDAAGAGYGGGGLAEAAVRGGAEGCAAGRGDQGCGGAGPGAAGVPGVAGG